MLAERAASPAREVLSSILAGRCSHWARTHVDPRLAECWRLFEPDLKPFRPVHDFQGRACLSRAQARDESRLSARRSLLHFNAVVTLTQPTPTAQTAHALQNPGNNADSPSDDITRMRTD